MTIEHETLIIKAARRYSEWGTGPLNLRTMQVADAQLNAFAEVAADIMRIATTPWEFANTIKECLRLNPVPDTSTCAAWRAEEVRNIWKREFIKDVYSMLDPEWEPEPVRPSWAYDLDAKVGE